MRRRGRPHVQTGKINIPMRKEKIFDHALILCPRELQGDLLAYRREYPEADFSWMSREEAENLFAYQHDDRSYVELLRLGVGVNEAKEMLSAMAFMNPNRVYASPRLEKIREKMNHLLSRKLLFRSPNPGRAFSHRHVVVYGYANIAHLSALLENVPALEISFFPRRKRAISGVTVHRFRSAIAELDYVFNRIADLIHNKEARPEDIYLAGLSEDYRFPIQLYGRSYGFDVDWPREIHLNETPCYRYFSSCFDEAAFSEEGFAPFCIALAEQNQEDPNLNAFLLLLKRYRIPELGYEKQRAIYADLLSTTPAKQAKTLHAVSVLKDTYAPMGSKVFFLNFSLGSAPLVHRDIGYLSDEDKEELGLPTSLKANIEENQKLAAFLSYEEVVSVSYPAFYKGKEFRPSPLLLSQQMKEDENPTLPYSYSKRFSTLLAGNLFDLRLAYGVFDSREEAYSAMALVKPGSYDNSFQPYSTPNPKESITLSFSSMEKYNGCPFSYFCEKVLELEDQSDDFPLRYGTLFHDILAHHTDEDFDLDQAFADAKKTTIEKEGKPFTAVEEAMLSQQLDTFRLALSSLQEREKYIVCPKYSHEFEIKFDIDERVRFYGRVDAAIVSGEHGEYVTLVDFKSSSSAGKKDQDLFESGLNLQLPTYSYGVSLLKEYSDKKQIGLFFVPFLSTSLFGEGEEAIEKAKKQFKWDGFFRDDFEAMRSLDPSLGGNFATCMSLSKQGWYSKAAKRLFTDEKLEDFHQKFLSAAKKTGEGILANDFPIEPKIIDDELACKECAFQDICFVQKSQLPSFQEEEGEEDDA